jgi:cation diffusion facilitator CzcD-associated flavoprotein CzcO
VTWAVLGAGYTGIAVAAALLEAGVQVDVLDRRPVPGGLWVDGVYDDVRLITSRAVTAYPGRPLPDGPTFPTGPELLAYLQRVARTTGVTKRLRRHEVRSVTRRGLGWDVDGTAYDGVVVATGLFTRPRIPSLPGDLSIPSLHTAAYKEVGQLGQDVLVVGLGNSGADVVQACVESGRRVALAVGRARHVLPRQVLGRPVTELRRPPLVPDLVMRLGLDAAVRLTSAYWRQGRLGEPQHLVLAETPVVHSALLPMVQSGAVRVRPAATRLDGRDVHFADGTAESFDTVVWATGYDHDVPVSRELVDAAAHGPLSLVGGVWPPVSPGLAVVGLREPRNGRGRYLAAVADLVVAGVLAQERTDAPVGALLSSTHRPDRATVVDDGPEIARLKALTRAAARL